MVGPELINSNGSGGVSMALCGRVWGRGGSMKKKAPQIHFLFFPSHFNRLRRRKKIEGLRLGIEEVVEVIKKKDHIIECWNKEGVRVASHFHYHKGRNFFKWSRNENSFDLSSVTMLAKMK